MLKRILFRPKPGDVWRLYGGLMIICAVLMFIVRIHFPEQRAIQAATVLMVVIFVCTMLGMLISTSSERIRLQNVALYDRTKKQITEVIQGYTEDIWSWDPMLAGDIVCIPLKYDAFSMASVSFSEQIPGCDTRRQWAIRVKAKVSCSLYGEPARTLYEKAGSPDGWDNQIKPWLDEYFQGFVDTEPSLVDFRIPSCQQQLFQVSFTRKLVDGIREKWGNSFFLELQFSRE